MIVLLLASYKSLNKGLSLYHTETMIIDNNNTSNNTTLNSIDKSKHNNNTTNNADIYAPTVIEISTKEIDNCPLNLTQLKHTKLLSTKSDELPLHYTLKPPGSGHNYDLSPANGDDDDNKKRKIDFNILLLILCIWLYYILIYFILHTIFTICTLSYFSVFALSFIPILIAIPVIITYLSRKQQLQQQVYNNNSSSSNNSSSGGDKLVLLEGDIYFNSKSIYTYLLPCISLIAGKL